MSETLKVAITAGEASGDRLGAALLQGLRQLYDGQITLLGVGGPLMQAEGLSSLFPMEELSIMGLAEVLPKLPSLLARVRLCKEQILAFEPDVLITIDSPDFCLRVARGVKDKRPHLKTVHYVAPSVWAWRPERAAKMARSIDHVLALLPFEPPYMEAAGMSCDFVGHPAAQSQDVTPQELAAFRSRYAIAHDAQILLVLPGSRRSEITRLSDTFGQALGRFHQHNPKTRFVLPTLAHLEEEVKRLTAHWPVEVIIPDPNTLRDKAVAFEAAHLALAASGTVSLELASHATPMVIAYDMNWISRRIIAAKLQIDTVTLVNLVTESRSVPEFLGDACQPEPISEALLSLWQEGPERKAQKQACALTMERLGRFEDPGGLRAAASVLAQLAKG